MSQRKTKLMWPEVIVRPNCGLSGPYVVPGRVKKYFRILDMEVLMLLMVWNAKVSIAPISFLIQEIPCNTDLYLNKKDIWNKVTLSIKSYLVLDENRRILS